MGIYMDNAATSFPKAPGISKCISKFINESVDSVNRSSHNLAVKSDKDLMKARELLCKLFCFNDISHMVFTPGITYSLNFLLRGFLKFGDQVIVSSMEHNSVMRPLKDMEKSGVITKVVNNDDHGNFNIFEFEELICDKTKLVVLTHASNVSGSILPIKQVGKICKKNNIPLILDTAQTAGHISIDFNDLSLSALAFTGHKGLISVSGIGGMLLSHEFANKLNPIISGGTGSYSDKLTTPDIMPDKFEPGTPNVVGIEALKFAVSYIMKQGIDSINFKQMFLTKRFIEGVLNIKGVELIGNKTTVNRVSVVSIKFKDIDNAEATYLLQKHWGIQVRCGLHCSPMAHEALGSYPEGSVRFSFSQFNTESEIDTALYAISKITLGKIL